VTRQQVYEFMRSKRYAVISTIAADGRPEAALVGIAVTPELELVFDTVSSSRKWQNLQANKNVAAVIGWDNELTVQFEGTAEFHTGEDLHQVKEQYFQAWPDGRDRQHWAGIDWIRVRPTWIRYCDYNVKNGIHEFRF
jgi:pyridoxine/pyridoxamine 5'-phosphate oxidase